MNVNQLQLPPPPQLQRVSKEAAEKDADFLALRLLNKRTRLRLSPELIPLDELPSRARLLAVANSKAWFAAATRNSDRANALVCSPLLHLRSVFTSSSTGDGPLVIQPRVTIPLPTTPHILTFNHDDSRLLVAFTDGSLSIYDSHGIFEASITTPLNTLPSSSGHPIRDIFPSTGDSQHVAILRHPTDPLSVEIFDVHSFTTVAGWTPSPDVNPTTVSWSPKGKQIAIGLENGDILTFSPTDTASIKSVIPHPPSIQGQSVISITWLSNSDFHAIYVPAGPLTPESEQTHFIVSFDSKASTVGDVKLTTPYLPFPGLRSPGAFVVTLRNWEPSRTLLFIGDGTSSDIGLIGSVSDSSPSALDSWYNFALEETSTPSVPLDADLNDTVVLGLDLDLADTLPFKFTGASGEETDVPPPPIMYLYASDGTLTGWHVIQTQGISYPGMVSSTATAVVASSVVVPEQTSRLVAPRDALVTDLSTFASTSSHNPTGTNSTFGFDAFSGTLSAFGNTSFGVGSKQPQQSSARYSPTAPALSAPTISVDMASADEPMVSETGSGFGSLSLGGGDEPKSDNALGQSSQASGKPTFGAPSFGQPTAPIAPKPATTNTFGSGGGFSSFATAGPSAFGIAAQQSTTKDTKPIWAVSSADKPSDIEQPKSAFGTAAAPTGGAFSALGQSNQAFGKTTFGTPSFGQPTALIAPKPATTNTFGSGGGFSSFATAGPSAFGIAAQQSTTKDTKPIWAVSSADRPSNIEQPKSAFGTPGSLSVFSTRSAARTPVAPASATPASSSIFAASALAEIPRQADATPITTPTSTPSPSPPPAPLTPAQDECQGTITDATAQTQSQPDVKPVWAQTSASSVSASPETAAAPTGGAFSALGRSNQAFGNTTFGTPSFIQPTALIAPKPATFTTNTFGSGGGFSSFGTAGPSAFGIAAQQSTPKDTKPIWAVSGADKVKDIDQPKSATGAASSFSSVFSTRPAARTPVVSMSATPPTPPPKSSAVTEIPRQADATPITTPTSTPSPSPPPAPLTPAQDECQGTITDATAQTQSQPDVKPVWAQASASSVSASPETAAAPTGGAFSALGRSNQAFGNTTFGTPSFSQPTALIAPKPATITTSTFGSGGGFSSFATAGPSAFGVAAQQSTPKDTKPTWAVSGADKVKDIDQPKSAIGATSSFSSVFSTRPAARTPVIPPSTTPANSPEKSSAVSALSETPRRADVTPITLPTITASPPLTPLTTPAQDMQSECSILYQNITKELEDMKAIAVLARAHTAQLARPGNGTKAIRDLSEPTKWVLSDFSQFKHIMKDVERDIDKWKQEKAICVSRMRELESDILKGSTRKEEIERFSKASKDVDFARMLKARMLSPDHLESQAQLRRDIRTIRGRLQQLEDYIQSSKKKLNSMKTGKPSIKPPTLETINRTYRNIDQAIDQDEESVYHLAERLEKLEFSANATPLLSFSTSTRDRRLPDQIPRRVSLEVTPNIAASTAAALNAERSAQKLKRTLLNTRKAPLLNTKAVDALPPNRESLAPGSGFDVGTAFVAGLNSGSGTPAPPPVPAQVKAGSGTTVLQWSAPPLSNLPPPAWSLPPFELDSAGGSPLSGLGALRPRAAREKQHAKPIQLTHKAPAPPPPAGFSWGPVPIIQPKSTISIFAGFGGVKKQSEEELEDCWVADGFGESTPQKK